MRAGLWTKLKASGPVKSLDVEIDRFKLWLPSSTLPLQKLYRQWRKLYMSASSAIERSEIEQQAIQELSQIKLKISEQAFILMFFQRIEAALSENMQAREKVLKGETVDANVEDQCIDNLLVWLSSYRHGKQKEMAALFSRFVIAWRSDRIGGQLKREP